MQHATYPDATSAIPANAGLSTDFPVSHGQAAIWFLYRMAPESAAYNIARAVHYLTPIDERAYRRALQTVTDRHPALRTTFHDGPEGPVQRVSEQVEAFLGVEDASSWTAERLRERLDEESQRPFRLEQGPLMRMHLFRLADGTYVCHLNIHHIISDLWSISILMNEVGRLHSAFIAGETVDLDPPGALFTDHVARQQAMLAGEEGEQHWAFWREELGGELPILSLPTDRPRPAVQSFRGATRNIRIDPGLSKTIITMGRKQGATPFQTLLAAYYAFLHRHTGQEEFIVGSPTAGRATRDVANVLGYFVNPVAFRGSVAGNPSFTDLLGRVKAGATRALAHQAYPFPLVVDRLGIERDPSRNPVYQAMFVFQRAHKSQDMTALALGEDGARFDFAGLAGESLPILQQAAGCDLTLFMAEVETGLIASLEYNADLFDVATIDRMLAHFVRLLEGIAADPSCPVGLLPMLSAAEREQLLVGWNRTEADYPRNHCVHELFEAQVAATPDAIAVACEGERLTYRELNRRANQLARRLRQLGVGPDVLAGVCLERRPALIVALLAVLKAGGAYLPLDPAYPADRLTYIVKDAQAPVVLTFSHLRDRLGEHGAQVICMDTDWASIARERGGNLEATATPENLCYAIYTSGSTGRPKGALIHHRGAVNYLWWARTAYEVAGGEGAPVHSSISFDLTVTSLWTPLLAGRRVELLPEARGIEALGAALSEQGGFSLVKLTPAHMELIARQVPPERAAGSARALVIGGEALQPEALAFWRRHAPATALVNEYGPTETVVGCCVHWVDPNQPLGGTVPIGRPIANTQLYILDQYMQPVPVGVHGELYIGGDGVCRGYLNRPDLTAERFLANPFGPGRLYKTGDLARYLPDGTIDYLGRIDEQVKIRGFRIELGEIETALSAHPDVDRVAAVVRTDGGVKRLVAYVVPAAGADAAPDAGALKAFAGRSLPEYMVPAAVVFLPELPLSPNGKVDRKALPAPDWSAAAEAYAAPRTEAEAKLAEIWAGVLGLERVGIRDHFFELGGDSILSIQVVARAARAGLKVTPQQLFQHPTIADLAAVAEVIPGEEAAGVAADQGPVTGEVPLTPIQRWFLEQDPADAHHYNQALMLTLRRPVAAATVERALAHLLEHHDALRLCFRRTDGGGWAQAYAAPGETRAAFRSVDLAHVPDDLLPTVIPAVAGEVQAGLDLETGRLVGAALIDLGPLRPGRLLLAIHHLAVDGVSWRILVEDLEALIAQIEAGLELALPPKSTSYQRWAEALAAHARSEAVEAERGHWAAVAGCPAGTGAAAGAGGGAAGQAGLCVTPEPASIAWTDDPFAPVPADHDLGPDNAASARTVTVALSTPGTRAFLQDVPAAYRTRVDDVLLAALARGLAAVTGRTRLAVSLEGHGREAIAPGLDLSRTVGWFTAIYPVVLDLEGAREPGEAIKRVKEQLRQVPSKGLGYGLLRYLEAPGALDLPALSATHGSVPTADPAISFNYLGQLDQSFAASQRFAAAPESAGPSRSPHQIRRHAIEIDARVEGGRLQFTWTYSANQYRPETIQALAGRVMAELAGLTAHCLSAGAGGCTPSDFPLAGLTQAELDGVLHHITTASGTPVRDVEDLYPLTPTQRHMLRQTQLAGRGSGMYVIQTSLRLDGNLDFAALERAWQTVTGRHAILRSSFVDRGLGQPLQAVHRRPTLPVVRFDWQNLPAQGQEHLLNAFLAEDRHKGFAAGAAPLMRVTLIRTAPASTWMVWSLHHLLIDGWGTSVVLQEVFDLYRSYTEGTDLRLDEPRPFREFVAWLAARDRTAAEAYWRRTLQGITAPTPIALPAPADPQRGRGTEECRLPAGLWASLQALARQHRLTPNTLLQGAWGLLLSRYSGQDRILFGATVSGRPPELPGIEQAIGCHINTVPVAVTVDAGRSLAEWLAALQAANSERKPFEFCAPDEVQAWSDLPRGANLFESVLVVENYPVNPGRQVGGITLGEVFNREENSFPVTLMALPGQELTLLLLHDRSRFSPAAARRMLDDLQHLLQAMAAGLGQRVGNLTLAAPAAETTSAQAGQTEYVEPAPEPVAIFHAASAD
jgi:amino acid adenylation domain-containing protein/non-ribosomal peptide synthase protein (TIGR01720 family)